MYSVQHNSQIWEYVDLDLAVHKFLLEYGKTEALNPADVEDLEIDIKALLARGASYSILGHGNRAFSITKID